MNTKLRIHTKRNKKKRVILSIRTHISVEEEYKSYGRTQSDRKFHPLSANLLPYRDSGEVRESHLRRKAADRNSEQSIRCRGGHRTPEKPSRDLP
ncbi:hypothetical protein CDAR_42091 [Caerostris darwini]|uniref:Uncharacterized protein n=1 Tax=Caerostris darwini TaxID=1538125 RepID=A0AAV4RJ42_9ARAC|nr:hypothetical protein CDAR_42091 [Caerostris darwini]